MYVRLFGHLIFLSLISALHATVACLSPHFSASDNFAASADIGMYEPATRTEPMTATPTRCDAIGESSR